MAQVAKKRAEKCEEKLAINTSFDELIAIELPSALVKGMETIGINNQEEYITYLIASSLLNYQKIFKDEKAEKLIKKIKAESDHQNYFRY